MGECRSYPRSLLSWVTAFGSRDAIRQHNFPNNSSIRRAPSGILLFQVSSFYVLITHQDIKPQERRILYGKGTFGVDYYYLRVPD